MIEVYKKPDPKCKHCKGAGRVLRWADDGAYWVRCKCTDFGGWG